MIVHLEYRCPECDKAFNCPANLASHRRWHKPKGNLTKTSSGQPGRFSAEKTVTGKVPNRTSPDGVVFGCELCHKIFRKRHSLQKHVSQFHNIGRRDGGQSPIVSNNPIPMTASQVNSSWQLYLIENYVTKPVLQASPSLSSCSPNSSTASSYSIADLLSPSKRNPGQGQDSSRASQVNISQY